MTFHVKPWHLLAAALLLAEMVTQTVRNLFYLHVDLTGDLIGIAMATSALILFTWNFRARRQ
jgi:hypothetical protein